MKKDFLNLDLRNNLSMEVSSILDTKLQLYSKTTIYFILSGQIEMLYNGQGVHLKKGDIYLTNPYDLVGFVADGDNHVLVTTLELEEDYIITNPMSPLYMKDAYDKISHTLAAIFLELESKRKGFEEISEGYKYRLLGLFKRYLTMKTNQERKKLSLLSDKNREIIDYINLNYHEDLSLDFLAEHFFISKFYLAHSFKNQIGLTLGNFIKEIRLIHSHSLVEKTDFSMIEIANEVGFSNVRSFSEGFKKKYGVPPLTYRQQQKEKTILQDSYIESVELGAIQILNDYAGIDGISQLKISEPKKITVKLKTEKSYRQLPTRNIFVRLEDPSIDEKLEAINKLNISKYVSVTNIIETLEIRLLDNQIVFNNVPLFKILRLIESKGLIPYIQISFVDYEKVKELTSREDLFFSIFNQLVYDIEREFQNLENWYVEFRCFYELNLSGMLCQPVKDIIPRFKNIGQMLIHLPVQPTIGSYQNTDEQPAYIIDDRATIRKYHYKDVFDILNEPKYIEIISENKNITLQGTIDQRMEKLDKDVYYKQFTGLIYANQMLWLFINSINQQVSTFEPMSLDGTSLFTYFPKTVSKKLSVLSVNNFRRDMWYAYQFRIRLFKTVVFSNEFCVVTKQAENYRLLSIYPEKEVVKMLFEKKSEMDQEPILNLNLIFPDLVGNYQIIEQKITPDIKKQTRKTWNISNSEKLSFDLIRYIDDMSQPMIYLKEEEISDIFSFSIELPIFGISFIEFNKLN